MPWNGEERRKNARDHDTLVEVMTILKNHVRNFDSHVAEDKDSFKTIGDKLWGHARYIYMALGALGVLNIIFGLHK